MKRRGFLTSILASGFAPAAIGSGVLMPIRQIIVPKYKQLVIANVEPMVKYLGIHNYETMLLDSQILFETMHRCYGVSSVRI